MDKSDALKAIKTLINVALESDDVVLLHKHLREMKAIVKKALPPVKR